MYLLWMFLLCTSSQATFLFPYTTPITVIQSLTVLETPTNISACSDVILNYCQSHWNDDLGLDESIDFRNGTYFWNKVQGHLDASQKEFNNTCDSFTIFTRCMGLYNDKCMNLFTLNQKPGTDQQNVFDYIRTIRGLNYMCGDGSLYINYKWDCLKDIPQTSAYKTCTSQFQNNVNTTNVCLSADQTGKCLDNVYSSACKTSSYGYSNFYTTFAKACTLQGKLRCY